MRAEVKNFAFFFFFVKLAVVRSMCALMSFSLESIKIVLL